jgi:hypothetical protein
VSDFDQEKVDQGLHMLGVMRRKGSMTTYLRRADHVLLGGHELDHAIVELGSLPAIHALLLGGIPIKGL